MAMAADGGGDGGSDGGGDGGGDEHADVAVLGREHVEPRSCRAVSMSSRKHVEP